MTVLNGQLNEIYDRSSRLGQSDQEPRGPEVMRQADLGRFLSTLSGLASGLLTASRLLRHSLDPLRWSSVELCSGRSVINPFDQNCVLGNSVTLKANNKNNIKNNNNKSNLSL